MEEGKPDFETLYSEHLGRIYGFLRSQLGSSVEAEDVTTKVFLKAYQAYPRYQPRRDTPTAWLFKIARNAALDHHRHAARERHLLQTLVPGTVTDPADVAERELQAEQLLELVSRLPERQREAVGLRHSGLSFQEVGELLDCSQDAAKMLYHRALKAVRSLLPEDPA